MAKRYAHVLMVKGIGSFPIDMLRYDRYSPHREEDSGKINRTFHPGQEPEGEIEVYTVSDSKVSPWTIGRWQSFCWEVVKSETRQLF